MPQVIEAGHVYLAKPPLFGLIKGTGSSRKIDYLYDEVALEKKLTEKNLDSIKGLVGAGLDAISDTTETLERDTILLPHVNTDKCVGCGRCVISCMDGGHQALHLNENRKPVLNGMKCVGCHLCILVCPEKAIHSVRKRIRRPKQNESE
jgi:dihydropyrimidine dehydrogenase (NAD+) subunit PreA